MSGAGEGGLPVCERCSGRLRYLGTPHHPDNPSAWACDPCEREAFVVERTCLSNGIDPPSWAIPLAALYDLHHGVSAQVAAQVEMAWHG